MTSGGQLAPFARVCWVLALKPSAPGNPDGWLPCKGECRHAFYLHVPELGPVVRQEGCTEGNTDTATRFGSHHPISCPYSVSFREEEPTDLPSVSGSSCSA